MLTLNLSAPAPAVVHRLTVLQLLPPLIGEMQYCAVETAAREQVFACAVIHPYRQAHLYEAAYPQLLTLLQREICADRQVSEIHWADIAYILPDGCRPHLIVRTAELADLKSAIAWRERDPSFARRWEPRALPAIDLLRRLAE